MKDMHSDTSVAVLIAAAALAADPTPPAVDLQGYDAAEIVISVGVGGITFSTTNKIEFVLTHSDDDVTYSNVEDQHVLGVTGITDGIVKSLVSAHGTASAYRLGYIGGKRYLKLLPDFSGTHGTATPISAVAVKGRAMIAPTANQA